MLLRPTLTTLRDWLKSSLSLGMVISIVSDE
jgi:hypothetical protein